MANTTPKMNDIAPDELESGSEMTWALFVGFFAALLLAIFTGTLASNALSCEFNRQTFDTVCEANVSAGFAFGIVTFVAVMLQAYIIGKILETNTLVKSMARVVLRSDTADETQGHVAIADAQSINADASERDLSDIVIGDCAPQDDEQYAEVMEHPQVSRTFGAWWLWVLAIIHLLYVGFVAADYWSSDYSVNSYIWFRLVIYVLHPIAALALLALLFAKHSVNATVLLVTSLLGVNITADIIIAFIGIAKNGGWLLPLTFSVIPAIAITYVVIQLRSQNPVSDQPQNDENPASV